MDLNQLGWNDRLAAQFEALGLDACVPARMLRTHGRLCVVASEFGELQCDVAGRLRHEAEGTGDLPALGDWVAVAPRPVEQAGRVHARLPRFSQFSRKAAGDRTDEQVIAANIHTALLMVGLDGNFNVRRIERYLTLTWNSGADPVIVLNKADMCEDVEARIERVEQIARRTPIHAISAVTGDGLEALEEYLYKGRSVVALGSSGVGKSTLVNALLGEERQATNAVREHDSHGRHTTRCGELIPLASGAVMIDTPGLREVQLWGDEGDVDDAFADIVELSGGCRFSDCEHGDEPGCAVQEAIADGRLEPGRLRNYRQMQQEMLTLADREQQRREKKEKFKQIKKWYRANVKRGPKGEWR